LMATASAVTSSASWLLVVSNVCAGTSSVAPAATSPVVVARVDRKGWVF
jgi:hypothetical protein